MKATTVIRRKRKNICKQDKLVALIERLAVDAGAFNADSTGAETSVRDAWVKTITLLLRLVAVRSAAGQGAWAKLLPEFEFVLAAPVVARTVQIGNRHRGDDGRVAHVVRDEKLATDDGQVAHVVRTDKLSADTLALIDEVFDSFGVDNEHLISRVYEAILHTVPHLDEQSGVKRLRAELKDRSKKRAGTFYSPPDLAAFVVERALARFKECPEGGRVRNGGRGGEPDSELKIVDPAMGAGIFLVQAYRFLSGSQRVVPNTRVLDASELNGKLLFSYRSFYGVDLDPLAVEAARLSLWLAVGDFGLNPAIEFSNLRLGNSLVGCSTRSSGASTLEELDDWCRNWFHEQGNNDASHLKFFHWETEFPDVFDKSKRPNPGFDAVIGNPPWEIEKPNSREFFGSIDDKYWMLGKQEALEFQRRILAEDSEVADLWNARNREHKLLSNWYRKAPVQFGTEDKPFVAQGSGDTNLYKLFCEQSYYLVRDGGSIALIVPSGIYSDCGARDLRRILLERCEWTDLIGFENFDTTFDIHRSFKYCVFVAKKGNRTEAIKTTFNGNRCSQNIGAISALSPKWSVITEVENNDVLRVLKKIYDHSVLVGDIEFSGSRLKYMREFDMTLDSSLFRGCDELERNGYVQDIYGNWLTGDWKRVCSSSETVDASERFVSAEDISVADGGKLLSSCGDFEINIGDVVDMFVPLYEGRMVGQFTANEKHWLSGKGRRAIWKPVERKFAQQYRPQYLVHKSAFLERNPYELLKVGFLAVGCATNARTMIATPLYRVACGNSVPVLLLRDQVSPEFQLTLTGCLNSFIFDFVIRRKMAGNNLNYFVVEECPLPVFNSRNQPLLKRISRLVAHIALSHLRFSSELLKLGFTYVPTPDVEQERQIRAYIDVLVAQAYGLDFDDLSFVIDGNRDAKSDVYVANRLVGNQSLRANVKGFFRVDRDLPIEERLPHRVLQNAYRLEQIGLSEFLLQVDAFLASIEAERNDDLARHERLFRQLWHSGRAKMS